MSIKLDVSLQSPENLSNIPVIAAAAERVGFDGIWSSEINHDPFVQLALAATSTKKITLGTSIALSFTRSPMSLAYTCWDLAALSQGRFILGLGTQVKAHNERRFSVVWESPVEKLREVIQGLRSIWHSWRTGERLNFRGQYFKFTLMTPFFAPPSHGFDIPITIAGVNSRLCTLAGEVCDGFHVHPLHSVKYLCEIVRPSIASGAERSGRSLNDVTLIASAFVVTGTTQNEVLLSREYARQQISFYASTTTYRVIFELHGWADIAEKLSQLAAKKQWDAMPKLITDEMINHFAIEGAPEEIGTVAVKKYRGLVNRLAFYLPFSPGTLDTMWSEAVKAFAGQ